jgi:predicted nucleic-acid-binding protein
VKGIDTNVLVRILLDDDAHQAERARAYVVKNAPCWLNRIVLCETVWVLERFNGFSRTRIALALRQILDTNQFEIEDVGAMQSGVAALEEGFDFADAMIAATNRSNGCDATATFDRKAARLPGFEAVV